jgi:hypothetical protein
MNTENLNALKDDMVAFIEGHGLRRLPGFVTEDLPAILWEDEERPDSWKDFVEMAKHCGAPFVTFSENVLEANEVEMLLEEANEVHFPDEEAGELAEAQWLRQYVGKLGYIQLGFVHQGIMVLHETTTEWYERFQSLMEEMLGFQEFLGNEDEEFEDLDEDEQE